METSASFEARSAPSPYRTDRLGLESCAVTVRDPPYSWTAAGTKEYTIHMKRTNLVLDPHLLEEATRVLRAKTYSAAVNAALKEILRVRRIQQLPEFFGSGIWKGNLAQMREDRLEGRRQLRRRSHR